MSSGEGKIPGGWEGSPRDRDGVLEMDLMTKGGFEQEKMWKDLQRGGAEFECDAGPLGPPRPSNSASPTARELCRRFSWGRVRAESRTEGCRRCPARGRCWDFNVIINNNNEAVRMSIIRCALRYQALRPGTGFSSFSHFPDEGTQAQTEATCQISARVWTDTQVCLTPAVKP